MVDLKKLLHMLVIRVSQLGVRRAVLRPCNISPDKASEIKVRQEFVGGPVHRVRRAGQRQRVQECLGESGGLDDRPLVQSKNQGEAIIGRGPASVACLPLVRLFRLSYRYDLSPRKSACNAVKPKDLSLYFV